MIVLSWKCRGLGNLHTVSAMKDLTRTHKPDIIFLCETLVHETKVQELKMKLGFEVACVLTEQL